MSEADATKFITKLEKDKKLQAELKKAKGDFATVAKKHKLAVTAADMRKVVKARFGGKKPPQFDDPNLTCV
jgi:hypothetical protein